MAQTDKTKKELIEEIELLQRRIAELEKSDTERKLIEIQLRESEQKARAIFDQTYQFIGLMTIGGILIEANRSALELVGIEASSVLGKPFWETSWWTHSPKLQEKLRQAIKSVAQGKFVRFEATHLAKDGALLYVDFSLKPVKDESGKVIFMIPEGRDITERKQAEAKLKKSEQELRKDKLLLEQKNLALKELLEQIERAKNKTKEDIAINMEELIMPIVKKLKIKGAPPKYVKLLEHLLNGLTSSFGRKITQRSARLTSREIEICSMIKGGLTSKDISKLLNVSCQTIEKHRKNIRKKLGLSHKKVNLTSHLQRI